MSSEDLSLLFQSLTISRECAMSEARIANEGFPTGQARGISTLVQSYA